MKIEEIIFSSLLFNEEYTRKVVPHLKEEYFQDPIDNKVYTLIANHVIEYNGCPTKDSLLVDLNNSTGLSDEQYEQCVEYVKTFTKNEANQLDWLVDRTESFCQDKAIYNGVMKAIQLLDDKVSNISRGAIPQILSDALGVSFNSSIGHDYIMDANNRYEFYHSITERIPFDLDIFNKITNGGLPNKSLTLALASTGVGKSAFMCHCAAANLSMGKNVLYITLEMSEEKIAERIEANLFDIPIQKLVDLDKETYSKYIDRIKSKTDGKLIIKEYPTASASASNFRYLINELKIKKNFIPDIIYIDYMNICASARVKNTQANSYTIIKSIAEELRGLAIEFDLPIVSATQTNRSGTNNSDIELENTSDSMGGPMTADFLFALMSTPELEELGQILVKQLKNRYNDLNYYKKFTVGLDRSKMKFYDVENAAQHNISDSGRKDNVDNDGDKKKKFGGFR